MGDEMGSIVSVFLFPNGSYCYCSCSSLHHHELPVSPSLLCVWWLSLSPHSSLALARGKGGWEKKPGGQGRRRPFWQAGITRCPRAAVRSGPDGWRGVAGGGPGCDRCRRPLHLVKVRYVTVALPPGRP